MNKINFNLVERKDICKVLSFKTALTSNRLALSLETIQSYTKILALDCLPIQDNASYSALHIS